MVSLARRREPIPLDTQGEAVALEQARNHLFERASVQHGHEVLAEAFNQSLGLVSLERLKQTLIAGHATDCVALKCGEHGRHAAYATREGLRQELGAIEVVNHGRNACAPMGHPGFQPDERLSADQRAAVNSLARINRSSMRIARGGRRRENFCFAGSATRPRHCRP